MLADFSFHHGRAGPSRPTMPVNPRNLASARILFRVFQALAEHMDGSVTINQIRLTNILSIYYIKGTIEKATVTNIARRLNLPRSTTSAAIARMVELGVFIPVRAPDGRKTYYTFTRRSQDKADVFFERILNESKELIDGIGAGGTGD